VVKNGIVMIDYAHRLHQEGEPFVDSIAHAARVRLRPILTLFAVPSAYVALRRKER